MSEIAEPKQLNLHEYQKEAIAQLREGALRHLRRQLLASPTGSGKTEMALFMILECVRKGLPAWVLVDRVTLGRQLSGRLHAYGIEHGIIQADNELTDPDKLVQVVSIQTLTSEMKRRMQAFLARRQPKLIVWDECHVIYKGALDLIAMASTARVIGLSATPFTDGMADHWDGLVNSTTVNRLLRPDEKGETYLVPVKAKACVTPNMLLARLTKSGEYDEEDAGDRGITIIGDVVSTWIAETQRFFGGPVPTIVFVPNVKHGAELQRQFAAAGYNFQQISYKDKSDAEREAKITEFRRSDSAIDGLISCAVLTKGFDVPRVMCGISCRPYRKSFSSHIQEMGRVMRKAPGKEFGLWLDHSGNCLTFEEETAWLYEHGVDDLSKAARKDSVVREPKERAKSTMFCRECGHQMEPGAEACGVCGWTRPVRGEITFVQGELIDVEIGVAKSFRPRSGLRAACLSNPRRIWNAALTFARAKTSKGDMAARKWAFGIWRGIYPDSRLPSGLFEAPFDPGDVHEDEWGLIDREVRRFRTKGGGRRAA